MVDVKRQDITLQDWTKGISADEFAWGSYFYSEWIQTWYSTKWFKLWHRMQVDNINERTTGRPLAVCWCKWTPLTIAESYIVFTKDCQLEMWGSFNGSTKWLWGEDWWWGLFQESNPVVVWTWGFVYGDYALAFTRTGITKIDYKNTYNIEYWQTITNPRFEDWTTWWTVWSWWTLTADGMQHTEWYENTLWTVAPWYTNGRGRFAIKVTNCTKWNVVVHESKNNTDVITTEAGRNGWFIGVSLNMEEGGNVTITITPSEDFDWTIEAVNFNVYDSNSYETISWLTSADRHLAIEWGWDIYITSWNTVDILSTIDWTISDSKKICREDEEIVAITQQADSLIIWATNWIDSRQYYWNWVDSVAAECIRWQWQIIKWATWTETISYVLTWSGTTAGTAFRLYSVSWYQRSLIASNAYRTEADNWNLEHYHPSKKFVFNDVDWPESMCIYMDNLYLPWCDGVYQFWQTIPWLSNSWSRPIKYANNSDKLFLFQYGTNLWVIYRNSQRTYCGAMQKWEYATSWYIVTDSIYWDKLWTRKALEKLKLWYKSIASRCGNIKIYAIVDDDYFWRFDVTWVTNRPKVWDVYTVAERTDAEIININKTSSTAWEITLRTVKNEWSLSTANRYLNKVSWDGDNQLDSNRNYDNMCLIKTIETEGQEFSSDLIFWKDFVNNYIPFWHKIQLVIELNKKPEWEITSNQYRTPEVYELSMVSDITDVVL